MSKAFKRIWREVALLRRYVGDVAKQWKGILGSLVVVSALWIAGHYGASLLARIVPLLPDTIAPWLTRNRLVVISVFFILAVGQYLVWRKLRLAADREQPEIDERLNLLQEQPGKADQPSAYWLIVLLEVVTDVGSPILEIESRGPIFKAFAEYYGKTTRLNSGEPKHVRNNLVSLEFPVSGFAAKDQLRIVLHSPFPLRLASARCQ